MRNIKLAELAHQWHDADQALVVGLVNAQTAVYAKYKIAKAIELAHFWGQVSWECGNGIEMTENLIYSAQRITEVWPTHFHTVAEAAPFAHNAEALGNKIYGEILGHTLGNTQPGDGFKFRGRGLIQTTGRDGYASLAKLTGLDLLNHPDFVSDPAHALECAVAEFAHYPGMLAACDADDVEKVTRLINGGVNGLKGRVLSTATWKNILGI